MILHRNVFLLYQRSDWAITRKLSSHQVSNALRPFYFLVHPDLFGKHPEAQAQNEKSLKTLNHYVETLVGDTKPPNPKDVAFFIKPRTLEEKSKNQLKSIKIRLKDHKIRSTVLTILKQANLPTGYVDKIEDKEGTIPTRKADRYDDDEYNGDDDEEVGLATPGYSPTD